MSQGSILVVGDGRLLRANLSNAMVQAGYEVAGNVSTGEEALEAVRVRRPDLVLMDLLLDGEVDSTGGLSDESAGSGGGQMLVADSPGELRRAGRGSLTFKRGHEGLGSAE